LHQGGRIIIGARAAIPRARRSPWAWGVGASHTEPHRACSRRSHPENKAGSGTSRTPNTARRPRKCRDRVSNGSGCTTRPDGLDRLNVCSNVQISGSSGLHRCATRKSRSRVAIPRARRTQLYESLDRSEISGSSDVPLDFQRDHSDCDYVHCSRWSGQRGRYLTPPRSRAADAVDRGYSDHSGGGPSLPA
jgi:hypothetical protein